MRYGTVLVLAGLLAGGCKIDVRGSATADAGPTAKSPSKKKQLSLRLPGVSLRSSSNGGSLTVKDGKDVVKLGAGAKGARLSVQSGRDRVTLKADDLGADIHVDERKDTVTLQARAKGAKLSVRSGEEQVILRADGLNATVTVKGTGKPAAKPKP